MYISITVMKFLTLKTHNPYINLAIEEYLFYNSNDDVFMLWQNEPTVVIGKNQNAYAEINMDFIQKNNVHIARRITGGGAVYHDLGNVNYTFISSKNEARTLDFAYFTEPIVEALRGLGIDARLSGRNDLLVGERKFSGNAQHANEDRILHHGTLLFDSDLDALSAALRVDSEKIKSKAIKSTRSRVLNLKELMGHISVDTFTELISKKVIDRFSPEIITVPSNEKIQSLYERNRSREWIFPEEGLRSRYSLYIKKRYDFGIVETYLNMQGEKITDIKIRGDFFGIGDISELEGLLCGKNTAELEKILSNTDCQKYIYGMTGETLLEHILSK